MFDYHSLTPRVGEQEFVVERQVAHIVGLDHTQQEEGTTV